MNKIKLFLLACVAYSTFSCQERLESSTSAFIAPEIALSDSVAFQALTMSAYRRLGDFGYYGQTMMLAPDVLADNIVLIKNTGRYIDEFYNVPGSHVDIWDDAYRPINDCNIVLANIDKAPVPFSKPLSDRLKAEALFIRALAYHDIAKVYGYEPGQEKNGWNKSAVIRLKPTTAIEDIDFRSRSTNTQVYEQIEKDLLEAETLLVNIPVGGGTTANVNSVSGFTQAPSRANLPAVRALLARVYFYWGKYQKAIDYAQPLWTTANLASASNAYLGVFGNAASPIGSESLFEIVLEASNWSSVDGANNSLASLSNSTVQNGQFIMCASSSLYTSMRDNDIRKILYITDEGVSSNGYPQYKITKWRGEKLTRDGLENLPVIRRSEMALITAESKALLGNLTGAVADINSFRTRRYVAALGAVPALPTSASLTQILDVILDENRFEFFAEGHRLFDLKRNKKGVIKPTNPDGSPVPPLGVQDDKFLARISLFEIQLNSLLQQNPGY